MQRRVEWNQADGQWVGLRFWVGWPVFFCLFIGWSSTAVLPQAKKNLKAFYIPLVDYFPTLVAYQRYREPLKYVDFQIAQIKNRAGLRAYFQSWKVNLAYVMSFLAIGMCHENPYLRVISDQYLHVVQAGLKHVMTTALEGGVLRFSVGIDTFVTTQCALGEIELSE